MEAKFVKEITVIDPDSKGEVQLAVYKHENGGMFAIDASYLEQVAFDQDLDDDQAVMITDPFSDCNEPDGVFLSD